MYRLNQGKSSHALCLSALKVSISAAFTLVACEGGETITPVINQPYGEPGVGAPVAGDPVAGMPMAGEPIAGMPMAGMPMAGEPVAGMPAAGEPVAGEPQVDCGLYSPQSRADLSGAPLSLFTSSCADAGCHDMNSQNRFKLSFNAPATPDGFSPEQLDEALSALEPYVTIGRGAESRITSRIIDNHGRPLGFDEQSPEYVAVTDWIDNLTPCE